MKIRNKSNFQFYLIIFVISITITAFGTFLTGNSLFGIYYRFLDWVLAFFLAISIDTLLSLKNHSDQKINRNLPRLLTLSPFLLSFYFWYYGGPYGESIFAIVYGLQAIIFGLVVIKVIKFITINASSINIESENINKNSKLENVIQLIENRAESSNKNILFSLISMIIIVIIGGSASFGTVALDEAKVIRQLEQERLNLINLGDNIEKLSDFENDELSSLIDDFREILNKKNKESDTYQQILAKMEEEQTKISWQDIAMRITIAVLTLFLVQIFFHIYKYNQKNSSDLYSKSELLKLYNDDESQLNELRNGLLSKIKANPEFEKSPSSPTEQIINIISKAKE